MQHGARWDKPDKDKDKARQKNIRLFDTDIFWSQKASSCVMEHAQKFTVLVFWQTFYVNHKILKNEFQTHCWCNHHLSGYFRWSIYECSWHIDSFENAKEDEVI